MATLGLSRSPLGPAWGRLGPAWAIQGPSRALRQLQWRGHKAKSIVTHAPSAQLRYQRTAGV
eukprot:3630314-Pyramimonas_sp.AAC.1